MAEQLLAVDNEVGKLDDLREFKKHFKVSLLPEMNRIDVNVFILTGLA